MNSDYVSGSITTRTSLGSSAASCVVNVPPVRRRGPRESVKENIEAAEIAAVAALVESTLTSLKSVLTDYTNDLGDYLDAMYVNVEPGRAQTEEN